MMPEISKAELSRQGSRWRLDGRPIVIAEDIDTDYHKGSVQLTRWQLVGGICNSPRAPVTIGEILAENLL